MIPINRVMKMQKLKTKNIVLNKEIASIFLEGLDEIMDSMELMMNPKLLKAIDKRLKDVKSGKKMKTMADFEEFMMKEGVETKKIKNEFSN